MRPTENCRYRKAASDYLKLPMDHHDVVALAWQALQAADMAAFEVLRRGGRKVAEGSKNHAISRDMATL